MTDHDRTGTDPHEGSAIAIQTGNGAITTELGVMDCAVGQLFRCRS